MGTISRRPVSQSTWPYDSEPWELFYYQPLHSGADLPRLLLLLKFFSIIVDSLYSYMFYFTRGTIF